MNFHAKLDGAVDNVALGDGGRTIVIGRAEAIARLYPQIGSELFPGDGHTELSIKSSHPEVPGKQAKNSTNPEVMVTVDNASKLWSLGSNNCVTCRYFRAGNDCPAFAARGKQVELNQGDRP